MWADCLEIVGCSTCNNPKCLTGIILLFVSFAALFTQVRRLGMPNITTPSHSFTGNIVTQMLRLYYVNIILYYFEEF
jgi:hypothetical protein